MLKTIVLLTAFCFGSESLIVPGELPTVLSLIYSNIPTIKKGTDSRLGWGFRLGNRADFQVLVELGPQTNTQPLANQPDAGSSSSKRNAGESLGDILWAQREQDKKKQRPKDQFSETNGGEWLKQWSQGLKREKHEQEQERSENLGENLVLGVGEVDAKLAIPRDGDEK